ncbi:MAG: hypothetical protein ACRCRW_07815 [Aeromonadaceae bacterium]|uniref:hypothetical protein n=1 Tax=Aeromonas jandaei TaxID=650 RepID=UPI00227A6F5E|nr:hypothetical protein [Aeromonas jandaei]WAG08229.1 hypothetical protein NRZ30_03955 [Aeromonas jandaei]
MHTDPNKLLALERALHQIDQLKARQPAGSSVNRVDPRPAFRSKSIEKENSRYVYRTQCPYVGIQISMRDVK